MTIGTPIVKINSRRRITTTVLISIMTQIALWNCIGSTNRCVGALSLNFPKLVGGKRSPHFSMPFGTSSMLVHQPSRSAPFISRSSQVRMMMSIVDDVTTEMKVAMKAKDSVTLGTIRLIRTAFANAAIELRTESLTDEQVRFILLLYQYRRVVAIFALRYLHLRLMNELLSLYLTNKALIALRKMAKMRKESIDMYESNGASDRADMERAELAVIERYLPAAVSEDVVREWAKEAIAEAGAIDNIGKVMGAFMKKHKSDVDGTVAQRIVKEEIEKMKNA